VFGGIFGLLGGYLTDRFGRRRVLVWSILLYAFSAGAAGFSTSLPMLLALRCTTFIGVCVEFVAAVAWLAEIFPHGKQRETVLGWTQAFSSLGGLMVAAAYGIAVQAAEHLPPIYLEHAPWRYTLISGVIPALPLILIRPFLPESPAWAEKRAAGTLRRPSIRELFQPAFRRTTVVTTLMMACSYGAAFGAIQHLPQIVPGLPRVTAAVRESVIAGIPPLAELPVGERGRAVGKLLALIRERRDDRPPKIRAIPELQPLGPERINEVVARYAPAIQKAREVQEKTVSDVQKVQELGGLAGRLLLALLAVSVASRRMLIRLFQVPGLVVLPLVFLYPARSDLTGLLYGIFAVGALTVAQFSFWGNYLPRVYPVHLRGTGESFAANIGGRLIGTAAALVTVTLAGYLPKGDSPSPVVQTAWQFTMAAAIVGGLVYLIGLAASAWLPEPEKEAPADA
jgi:MFS family permease